MEEDNLTLVYRKKKEVSAWKSSRVSGEEEVEGIGVESSGGPVHLRNNRE